MILLLMLVYFSLGDGQSLACGTIDKLAHVLTMPPSSSKSTAFSGINELINQNIVYFITAHTYTHTLQVMVVVSHQSTGVGTVSG